MLVLDDYTTVLSSREDINLPLRRFTAIFSNNRAIATIFKFFRVFSYINKQNSANNIKMRQQLSTFKVLENSLKNIDLKGKDLSKAIIATESQIMVYVDLKYNVEDFLKHSSVKLFANVKTTDKILEETISTLYKILKTFKTNTKKSELETSQLATDITNHSENTLADILNGD